MYIDKRDKKINTTCDFQASKTCLENYKISIRARDKNIEKNNGKYICFFCSRHLKHSGRNNPNCRYKMIDDNLLEKIDSEEKAYLLGWIASDGTIDKHNSITIGIHKRDEEILNKLKEIVSDELKIKHKNSISYISFSSKKISEDICKHLEIHPGAKSKLIRLPKLETDELFWSYIRGHFDGDGYIMIDSKHQYPRCAITSTSKNFIDDASKKINIHHTLEKDKIVFSGNNAIDFLGKLYDNKHLYLSRKRDLYYDICSWVPGLSSTKHLENFRWIKTRNDAYPPSKSHATDSGFDLTLLEKTKQIGDVELYDTGIKIQPDYGWYFDLVPRSSIIKTGYMLANSVGVIDRTYVGNVLVPLIKINKNAPNLELPCRIVQIIPRPIIHIDFKYVNNLDDTKRGEGGFGSTGTK